MDNPKRIYELLLDYAIGDKPVNALSIGLVWTVCEAGQLGLAMSPNAYTRNLPWSGSLAGKPLSELASWINDWEPYKATIGMAAINCSLNAHTLPGNIGLVTPISNNNLAVFEHFLPQLTGQKIVVIGRYPGIERYAGQLDLSIIERQPLAEDYPDPACEYLLPNADWVFLTASSIPNKTFPRLAELAQHAKTVLLGPTVPWFPELHTFGIDYLAGVQVVDPLKLYQTVCEGGGVRIFEGGVRYQIMELNSSNSMAWLQQSIAQDYSEKHRLTAAMEQWYAAAQMGRFPDYKQLSQIGNRLSAMDSTFKRLWDAQQLAKE